MRLGLPEIIAIGIIILVVFGGTLIPKLAKTSVQTIKDTKKELKEMRKEDNDYDDAKEMEEKEGV